MSREPRPLPSAGRERLLPEQEDSLDALVACFGDGHLHVAPTGVAEIIHTEHPQKPSWLVNPEGDVAHPPNGGAPTFDISREEVQQWSAQS